LPRIWDGRVKEPAIKDLPKWGEAGKRGGGVNQTKPIEDLTNTARRKGMGNCEKETTPRVFGQFPKKTRASE